MPFANYTGYRSHRKLMRVLWFFLIFFTSLGLYTLSNFVLRRMQDVANQKNSSFEEFLPIVGYPANNRVPDENTEYNCYALNDRPYLKFGTRTAYHFVHGGETRYEKIPNCQPVQIWMLIRHGTKYPETYAVKRIQNLAKLRDEIIENHERRGSGHLCKADLENLKNWHLDPGVHLRQTQDLTDQGIQDLNQLGRRIRSNFPELFPSAARSSEVNAENYQFRSASEPRAKTSAKAFMLGLLDSTGVPEIPTDDTIFAGYSKCPGWVTMVARNRQVLKEPTKFKDGPEYQKLISNVSRRLGFLKNVTVDSVQNMREMCRLDKSWKVEKLSPWCAVFTEEELKIFEYKDDLTDYYKRGHGHEYNIRLGCPLMRQLFQYFQKLEADDYSNQPKGVFNVCNSRTLHPFMAAMGFAKDSTPPLASDFKSMDTRQWRTSEIGSFAANVAAVFYKCNGTGSPNKVRFYIAEKPVDYEGCDSGLCDWEYLKNKFPHATLDCNMDFCNPPPSAT